MKKDLSLYLLCSGELRRMFSGFNNGDHINMKNNSSTVSTLVPQGSI